MNIDNDFYLKLKGVRCGNCYGKGTVDHKTIDGSDVFDVKCLSCNGKGYYVINTICPCCDD